MADKDATMKQKLADIFCEIMEQAFKKIPPFDDVGLSVSDYAYVYRSYLRL